MKFQFSKFVASVATLSIIAFGAVAIESPADAASYSTVAGDPVGLMVKYDRGVNLDSEIAETIALAKGQISDLQISHKHSLGARWHTFRYLNKLTPEQASLIENAVDEQSGVSLAETDKIVDVTAASTAAKSLNLNLSSARTAVTVASAVKTPAASDGWVDDSSRAKGRVNLTWTRPTSFGSYPFYGYRIQISTNRTTWANACTACSNVGKVTSYTVGELTPAKRYYFKIAALTKSGSSMKVGKYSAVVSAVPTSIPAPPVLATKRVMRAGDLEPTWYPQTKSQRGGGGLVTYTARATATGHTTKTCTKYTYESDSYTCNLSSQLDADVDYNIAIFAENSHGVSSTASAVTMADPFYASSDKAWHLKDRFGVNAPGAWAHTKGSGVTVAVIDTGMTYIPELKDQYFKNSDGSFYGYDFVSSSSSANDGNGWDANPLDQAGNEGEWHGTEVASIMAAKANSVASVGVAPEVKVLPVRVIGENSAPFSDIIAGIIWAAGFPNSDDPTIPQNLHPAEVLNLSIQTSEPQLCGEATQDVINQAVNAGVTVVAAAGNYGDQGLTAAESYPGNCENVITVGATNDESGLAYYSNRGPGVTISAPGGDFQVANDPDTNPTHAIWFSTNSSDTLAPANDITTNQSYTAGGEGTSYSAPVVSGVIALMYAANPDISFWDVYKIITATAQPFESAGTAYYDCTIQDADTCGAGIIDAGRAVAAAERLP